MCLPVFKSCVCRCSSTDAVSSMIFMSPYVSCHQVQSVATCKPRWYDCSLRLNHAMHVITSIAPYYEFLFWISSGFDFIAVYSYKIEILISGGSKSKNLENPKQPFCKALNFASFGVVFAFYFKTLRSTSP